MAISMDDRTDSQRRDLIDDCIPSMGAMVSAAIERSIDALENSQRSEVASALRLDDRIDQKFRGAESRIRRLVATGTLEPYGIHAASITLKIAGDLEKMGNYCASIARLALENVAVATGDAPVAPAVRDDLRALAVSIQWMLGQALWAYSNRDPDAASDLVRQRRAIEAEFARFRLKLAALMGGSPAWPVYVTRNLEQISALVLTMAGSIAALSDRDSALTYRWGDS